MNNLTNLIQQHQNSILIAVIVFLTAITLYGHYRGFIKMAVSFGSVIISAYLVKWILPFVTEAAIKSGLLQKQADRISGNLFRSGAPSDYSVLYGVLGLDRLAEATGEYLAGIIINVICFVVLFIMINILFKVGAHFLNALMGLPILHGTNQLLGAALGFAEGVFYLWIFMLAISFTPASEFSSAVMEQIAGSPFLLWVYQNNFLLHLLAGFLGLA
ncbi:MAG: CvpA family protein [Eubacteriales bacterium]|nr:CvpA family protein [Eubacteriales bacterium]